MFVKFKDLEGIFKDLIPYQKRIKSLYRKIVELGYTGTEEEFVNFIYAEVTANLGKQDIKDKFKEIEDSINIIIDTEINKLEEEINKLEEKETKDISALGKNIGEVKKNIKNVQDNIVELADNVLLKSNESEYMPNSDYNPATKKYVDDTNSLLLVQYSIFNFDINDIKKIFKRVNTSNGYSIVRFFPDIDVNNNNFYYYIEYLDKGEIYYKQLLAKFDENNNMIDFYTTVNICGIDMEVVIYYYDNGYLLRVGCQAQETPTVTPNNGEYINVRRSKAYSKIFHNDLCAGKSLTVGARTGRTNFGSVSMGNFSKSEGRFSYAEGNNTIASCDFQHVQGQYNMEDLEGKYAHIVGNGKYKVVEPIRSNAHTLDWNGNAWYAGNVYTGGTGQDDENAKKLATEEFVANSITEITKSKDYFILKDAINKHNYVIQMQNGSLVSFIKTASIKIATPPTKTDYTDTEEFDPTGMVVVAVKEDNSEEELTDYTYDKYVTTESTTHEIKYIDKTGTEYTTEVFIVTRTLEEALADFNYTANSDGTYTITGWKGTRNGVASTEMVFPNSNLVIL